MLWTPYGISMRVFLDELFTPMPWGVPWVVSFSLSSLVVDPSAHLAVGALGDIVYRDVGLGEFQ